MRAGVLAILTAFLLSVPAYALDAGKAEGSLTVNGTVIPLSYAYAIGHQKNQITNRNDDVKVILTDKPLLPDVDLKDFESTFPDGVLGIVVCIDKDKQLSHIVVQHPNGMYDAGYFSNLAEYRFRTRRGDPGTLSGTAYMSKSVATATIQFTFDVTFVVAMR
jgi:hypothetical protein